MCIFDVTDKHIATSRCCGVNDVGIGTVGEMVIIHNVTRYCDDIYECIASNGVPPTVSRQMRVTVECNSLSLSLSLSLSFFLNFLYLSGGAIVNWYKS